MYQSGTSRNHHLLLWTYLHKKRLTTYCSSKRPLKSKITMHTCSRYCWAGSLRLKTKHWFMYFRRNRVQLLFCQQNRSARPAPKFTLWNTKRNWEILQISGTNLFKRVSSNVPHYSNPRYRCTQYYTSCYLVERILRPTRATNIPVDILFSQRFVGVVKQHRGKVYDPPKRNRTVYCDSLETTNLKVKFYAKVQISVKPEWKSLKF